MKSRFNVAEVWSPAFAGADYPDCFIPELWAAESLQILFGNTLMLPLVHTDFSNEVAKYGDIVNTRRPDTMTAARKADGDTITFSRPTATNVPIRLNQHIHQSFVIYDGEESKAFKDLVNEYLKPAVESIAVMVDQILVAQMYQFLAGENQAGKLGTAMDEDTVLAAQKVLEDNKVKYPRHFVVNSKAQQDLLSVATFVEADKTADGGQTLRSGALGNYFGFNFFMSHNMPYIAAGNTTKANAVNNSGGYSAGDTAINYDGAGDPVVGEWLTIAGDMTPQLVTADDGSTLTLWPGLQNAVDDDAVITTYTGGAINLGAGYAQYYTKELVVDGFSVAANAGQLATIGATAGTSPFYGIVGAPDTTGLYMDRGLDAAVVDDAVVGIGPAGGYNMAFHPNAIGFISRPLAKPRNADSAVLSYKGLGIRVVMDYDMDKQGTKVTVDILAGVTALNNDMGVIVFN